MEYQGGDASIFSVAPGTPPTNLEEQATLNPVPFNFRNSEAFALPRGAGGPATSSSAPGTPVLLQSTNVSPTIGAFRPSPPLAGRDLLLDSVLGAHDTDWSYCYAGAQDSEPSYQLSSGACGLRRNMPSPGQITGWPSSRRHSEPSALAAMPAMNSWPTFANPNVAGAYSAKAACGSGGKGVGNTGPVERGKTARSRAPQRHAEAPSTPSKKKQPVEEPDHDYMEEDPVSTNEYRPRTKSERPSSSTTLLDALLTRNPPPVVAKRGEAAAEEHGDGGEKVFNLRSGFLAAPSPALDGAGDDDQAKPDCSSSVVIVRAKYSKDSNNSVQSLAAKTDGMIMSETRREWMKGINKSISGAVKGQICAHGSVHDSTGLLRDLIVVAPEKDCMPSSDPLLRIDVRRLAQIGKELSCIDLPLLRESDKVGHPLARPSFSPFETGVCAIATEQHPLQADQEGFLWIVQASRNGNFAASTALRCPRFRLDEPVSAMDWLGTKELLVASGKQMLILSVGESVRKRTVMPQMHSDDIRDMQLSNFQRNQCLSGGYDGKLFITDCERVVSDQLSWRSESKNLLYSAGSAISSVAWNPVMSHFASFTTDSGCMHCFDTRLEGSEKPTIVIETRYPELYTHSWADAYGALLGWGDGTLRLFDIRKAANCVASFKDPHLEQCGDIAFDPQRRYFVACGSPGFSMWRSEAQAMSLWYTDPRSVSAVQIQSDVHYKNSGAFMLTGGRQHAVFGVTDAHGFFSLYDVNAAGEGAIDISQGSQGGESSQGRKAKKGARR